MTRISITATSILAALVAVVFIYQAGNRETLSAAQFRADSGYGELRLSDGVTAYRSYGAGRASDAPTVIIVHGGTLGSMAYQGYVAPLVMAGYRVVLYDQYGRGFSDRAAAPLSIDLMRRQLLDLIDALDIERAHLFGVSFGGAIIARFAAEHGDRVRSLAYQVPVIEGASVSPTIMLTRMPIIGPALMRFLAIPAIIARGESFGTQSEEARRVVTHFKQQFSVEGTERQMRQMLIGDALSDRMADHRRVGASGVAAQFVYATDDSEIAAEQVEAALALYNAPQVHQYTGGHFFSSGKTLELAEKLDGFFKSVD